jgi:hypothetical protein
VIKPPRDKLLGMSASEFKTLLKRRGFKVPRNFFKMGCISEANGRYWRWRWWADDGFVVDVSEPFSTFDRWANSTDTTVYAHLFLEIPNPLEET